MSSSPRRMETTEPPQRHIPWHRQPLKTIFLTLHLTTLVFVLVPWTTLKFIPRSNRPSPNWSLARSVQVFFLRNVIRIVTNAGTAQSRSDVTSLMDKSKLKMITRSSCKGVWLEPVREDQIYGEVKEWMIKNGVKPQRVPAYLWGNGVAGRLNVQPASEDEKIIVHFHGGGYVMGSARPSPVPTSLAQLIHKRLQLAGSSPVARILDVDYRLSRAEPLAERANPFPAALLDGLAAVHYLVFTLGFHPWNIILSGDSAGGNLALALTRYLRDAPLPASAPEPPLFDTAVAGVTSLLPGGLILESPWCDIASTHIPERAGPNCSFVRNSASDIVGRHPYSKERPYLGMSAYGLRGFSGVMSRDEVARNPYISPGSLDISLTKTKDGKRTFKGYPPTYISVGGREILHDEILRTAELIQSHASREHIVPSPKVANGSALHEGNANGNASMPLYSWVTVDEEPDMFHDFCGAPFARTEGMRTLDRIVTWIAELPRGTDHLL